MSEYTDAINDAINKLGVVGSELERMALIGYTNPNPAHLKLLAANIEEAREGILKAVVAEQVRLISKIKEAPLAQRQVPDE